LDWFLFGVVVVDGVVYYVGCFVDDEVCCVICCVFSYGVCFLEVCGEYVWVDFDGLDECVIV